MKLKYIIWISLLAISVNAQEITTEMEAIVVSEELKEDVSTIQSKDIDQKQAADLRDTFKNSSEVIVGGSVRATQKIYVRGLEDTNLNVTVDGARQSGYLFHHQGRLSIDPELLKKVEVEAGTGGALSGPGALGGSLRFETKDTEDLLPAGQNWGSLVKARYHTNNDLKGMSFGLYGKPQEKFGILLYGNLAESINGEAGGGETIDYSAADPKSGLLKLSYSPSLSQKLVFSTTYTEDNAARLVRSNYGNLPGSNSSAQEFGSTVYALNYNYDPEDHLINLHANIYESFQNLRHERAGAVTKADVHSYGVALKNTFDLSSVDITTGFDFNTDESVGRNISGKNDETGEVIGVFTQVDYTFTPRWLLGVGIRYDRYSLVDVRDNEIAEADFSPSILLTHKLTDVLKVFASWSRAFKGPTPVETFLLGSATSVTPYGDLEGTIADTYELGTKYKVGDLESEVITYYTRLNDPLESGINRTTGVLTRRNVDDILTYGFSASIAYQWDLLKSTLSYAHNKSKFGEQPMGYTRNHRGMSYGDRILLNLDYQIPTYNLLLTWESLVTMKLTDVPAGQEHQPGYNVHDVSVSWFAKENLKFGLAVNNIFDTKYTAQGTVYSDSTTGLEVPLYEPGIDFRLSAVMTF